jgi:hypothetical protein
MFANVPAERHIHTAIKMRSLSYDCTLGDCALVVRGTAETTTPSKSNQQQHDDDDILLDAVLDLYFHDGIGCRLAHGYTLRARIWAGLRWDTVGNGCVAELEGLHKIIIAQDPTGCGLHCHSYGKSSLRQGQSHLWTSQRIGQD